MLGSPSQSGEVMPTLPRMVATRPKSGCSSTLNVMPTATVLTRTGKNTTERRRPRERIGPVSRTAKSMPSTTLRPLVTTA